eukprot:Skav209495  [mRNA]  locus=scaffold1892:309981:310985:+ [translate_table: standard]
MNNLALDYFALDELGWAPGHCHPDVQVEDFPLGQVKWHWDAPPLADAMMQVYCPMSMLSASSPITCLAGELAAELECFCRAKDSTAALQFPQFAAVRPCAEELLEDERWTPRRDASLECELLSLSHQWLEEYAAQKAQDMKPEDRAAIRQVDQQCEWINQLAESHDFKEFEMQRCQPDVLMEETGAMTSVVKTDTTMNHESIAPNMPEITEISSPVAVPVLDDPGTESAADLPLKERDQALGDARMAMHRPPVLSKVWQAKSIPGAANAHNAQGTEAERLSVRSLDLKELGVDSLPCIWTLESLPGEPLLSLPSSSEPSRRFVVDGHFALLGCE